MGEWNVYCAICGGPFERVEISRESNTARFRRLRREGLEAIKRRDQNIPDDKSVDLSSEEDDADSLTFCYDPEIIAQEDADWCLEMYVLGFNPNAPGLDKTFLSGPGEYLDYGEVQVDEWDDPNYPSNQALMCYNSEEMEPVFPLHLCCYELLEKCLTSSFEYETVDTHSLYDLMYRVPTDADHRLEVNYGIAEQCDWQRWESKAGEEFLVLHPTKDRRYKQQVLDKLNSKEFQPSLSVLKLNLRPRVRNDPFSKLPHEILLEILYALSTEDIIHLINASWTVHSALEDNNSFWKAQVQIMTSWFSELEEALSDLEAHQDLDFKRMCLWAEAISRPRRHIRGPFMALANRRRIWNVCQQLAGVYGKRCMDTNNLCLESIDESLQSATSTHMPVVSFPLAPNREAPRASLWIQQIGDIHTTRKLVENFWDLDGSLVGLSITSLGQKRNLFGRDDFDTDVTVESSQLDEDSWVTGLILHIPEIQVRRSDLRASHPSTHIKGVTFTTTLGELNFGKTEAGYPKRPLLATEGWCAVGLIGQTSFSGDNWHISRLGLLQIEQPGFDDKSEKSDASETSDEDNVPTVPPLQRWLWSDDRADILGEPIWNCPEYRMVYGEGNESFWEDRPNKPYRDIVPLEALIWARDRAELRSLKRLSGYHTAYAYGEPYLCGLSAEFIPQHRKSPRVIGITYGSVMQAPQDQDITTGDLGDVHDPTSSDTSDSIPRLLDPYVHFDIDGPGGEYITEVLVSRDQHHRRWAIKLRTNRSREMQWGQARIENWRSITASEGDTIVGLCMTFAEFAGRNGEFHAYGRFSDVVVLTKGL